MPHKANQKHYDELEVVITLAEACRVTGIPRQTLSYAIDAGNLAGVRIGRIVIISKRSLSQYAKKLSSRS